MEQNGDPHRDTDGDNYPDHMDHDSDNDGCFDVIETGFADEDGNGILGDSPDTVEGNGLITEESSGYTSPLDTNGNGIYHFQEANMLSAGEDSNIQICIDDAPVNLFNELKGNPNPGGS